MLTCCFLQICSVSYPARISCAKTLIELENYDVRFVLRQTETLLTFETFIQTNMSCNLTVGLNRTFILCAVIVITRFRLLLF